MTTRQEWRSPGLVTVTCVVQRIVVPKLDKVGLVTVTLDRKLLVLEVHTSGLPPSAAWGLLVEVPVPGTLALSPGMYLDITLDGDPAGCRYLADIYHFNVREQIDEMFNYSRYSPVRRFVPTSTKPKPIRKIRLEKKS